MSYTFTIGTTPSTAPKESFAAAGFSDIACREGIDFDDLWTSGVYHFYRPGTSCRTIEVTVSDDNFEVRLMAHSSREDYQLGLGLAHAVACESGNSIYSEEGDIVSPFDFLRKFSDAWISRMMRSDNATFQLIARQNAKVQVNGAMRPFVLGEVMMRKLGFTEDPEGFQQRFIEAMRYAQWLELSDCFEASVMTVTLRGSANQRTLSVIGAPELRYLIHKVDFIAAMIGLEMVFVPWQSIEAALGKRVNFVHEELLTIEPILESEWPMVQEEIGRFATPLE